MSQIVGWDEYTSDPEYQNLSRAEKVGMFKEWQKYAQNAMSEMGALSEQDDIDYFNQYGEEATKGILGDMGLPEALSNAFNRGMLQAKQNLAMGLATAGVSPGEQAAKLAELEKEKDNYPASWNLIETTKTDPKADKLDQATSYLKKSIQNPGTLAETLVESLASQFGTQAGIAPEFIGAGALATAATGPGAAAGAAGGFILSTGAASFANEYTSKFISTLRDQGVDVEDPKAMTEVFESPEKMKLAKEKAMAKGVPVAVFDTLSAALSFGVGAKVASGVVRGGAVKTLEKTAEGALKESAKQIVKPMSERQAFGLTTLALGGDIAFGMAGEATGQKFSEGQITDVPGVVAEGLVELVPGMFEFGAGAVKGIVSPTFVPTTEANLKAQQALQNIENRKVLAEAQKLQVVGAPETAKAVASTGVQQAVSEVVAPANEPQVGEVAPITDNPEQSVILLNELSEKLKKGETPLLSDETQKQTFQKLAQTAPDKFRFESGPEGIKVLEVPGATQTPAPTAPAPQPEAPQQGQTPVAPALESDQRQLSTPLEQQRSYYAQRLEDQNLLEEATEIDGNLYVPAGGNRKIGSSSSLGSLEKAQKALALLQGKRGFENIQIQEEPDTSSFSLKWGDQKEWDKVSQLNQQTKTKAEKKSALPQRWETLGKSFGYKQSQINDFVSKPVGSTNLNPVEPITVTEGDFTFDYDPQTLQTYYGGQVNPETRQDLQDLGTALAINLDSAYKGLGAGFRNKALRFNTIKVQNVNFGGGVYADPSNEAEFNTLYVDPNRLLAQLKNTEKKKGTAASSQFLVDALTEEALHVQDGASLYSNFNAKTQKGEDLRGRFGDFKTYYKAFFSRVTEEMSPEDIDNTLKAYLGRRWSNRPEDQRRAVVSNPSKLSSAIGMPAWKVGAEFSRQVAQEGLGRKTEDLWAKPRPFLYSLLDLYKKYYNKLVGAAPGKRTRGSGVEIIARRYKNLNDILASAPEELRRTAQQGDYLSSFDPTAFSMEEDRIQSENEVADQEALDRAERWLSNDPTNGYRKYALSIVNQNAMGLRSKSEYTSSMYKEGSEKPLDEIQVDALTELSRLATAYDPTQRPENVDPRQHEMGFIRAGLTNFLLARKKTAGIEAGRNLSLDIPLPKGVKAAGRGVLPKAETKTFTTQEKAEADTLREARQAAMRDKTKAEQLKALQTDQMVEDLTAEPEDKTGADNLVEEVDKELEDVSSNEEEILPEEGQAQSQKEEEPKTGLSAEVEKQGAAMLGMTAKDNPAQDAVNDAIYDNEGEGPQVVGDTTANEDSSTEADIKRRERESMVEMLLNRMDPKLRSVYDLELEAMANNPKATRDTMDKYGAKKLGITEDEYAELRQETFKNFRSKALANRLSKEDLLGAASQEETLRNEEIYDALVNTQNIKGLLKNIVLEKTEVSDILKSLAKYILENKSWEWVLTTKTNEISKTKTKTEFDLETSGKKESERRAKTFGVYDAKTDKIFLNRELITKISYDYQISKFLNRPTNKNEITRRINNTITETLLHELIHKATSRLVAIYEFSSEVLGGRGQETAQEYLEKINPENGKTNYETLTDPNEGYEDFILLNKTYSKKDIYKLFATVDYLKELYNQVVKISGAKEKVVFKTELSNLDEFLAYSFTDPNFQSYLASIKIKGKTAFEKLKQFIADIFKFLSGMSGREREPDNNVLRNVLETVDSLVGQQTQSPTISPDLDNQNLLGSPNPDDVIADLSQDGAFYKWSRKWFSSRGLLPQVLFDTWVKAQQSEAGEYYQARQNATEMRGILKGIQKSGGDMEKARNLVNTVLSNPNEGLKLKAREELMGIDPKLHDLTVEMRDHIDQLSLELANLMHVPEKLRGTVLANLRTYLNRSYEIFDNPEWAKNLVQAINAPQGSKVVNDNAQQIINAARVWASNDLQSTRARRDTVKSLRKENQLRRKLGLPRYQDEWATRFNALNPDAKIDFTTKEGKKLADEKYRESADFKAKYNANLQKQNPITVGEANRYLTKIIDQYRQPDIQALVRGKGNVFRKNLDILKYRENIPEELRKLLGEYTDPDAVYFRTAQKLSSFLAKDKFLSDFAELGKGVTDENGVPISQKFLYDKESELPANGDYVKFRADNPSYAPLDGKWMPRELADVLAEHFKPEEVSEKWFGVFRKATGLAMLAKTGYSFQATVRNFLGNIMQPFSNGHVYRSSSWRDAFANPKMLKEAAIRSDNPILDALRNKAKDEKAWSQEIKKLISYGIIGENIDSNLIKEFLKQDTFISSGEKFLNSGIQKGKLIANGLKEFNTLVNRNYASVDHFWKVLFFEADKSRYGEIFPGAPENLIEEYAARVVRDTTFTYSMSPKSIRALSRTGVLAPFVRFSSEVIRTVANQIQLAKEEITGDTTNVPKALLKYLDRSKMRKSGWQRFLGLSTTFVLLPGAVTAIGMTLGIDKDDEDKIRRYLPSYWKNAQIAVIGKNNKGEYKYLNLSFINPYAYFAEVKNSIFTSEGDIKDKMAGVLGAAFRPFVSEQLLVGALMDVARNRTADGKEIYNPRDPDASEKILAHVAQPFVPGTAQSIGRIVEGYKGEVRDSGYAPSFGAEFWSTFTGTKISQGNVVEGWDRKIRGFKKMESDTEQMFTKVLGSRGTVTPERLTEAYDKMEQARYQLWQEFRADYEAARGLGLDIGQAVSLLKANKVSDDTIRAVVAGRYIPYRAGKVLLQNSVRYPGGTERLRTYLTQITQEAAKRSRLITTKLPD